MGASNSIQVTEVTAFCSRHSFWAGLWRLADPKISLASFAAILLGACAAAREGSLHWGWLAVTVFGIFAIEVAKNASGEIFDFDSGTDLAVAVKDRSPFSGGKRVLVDGLLKRRETIFISAVGYLTGAAAGFWIIAVSEPRVLWIGLVGLGCAYFYHATPLQLSYRGLGELAVGVCYGPLIASGTFLVQRGNVPFTIVGPSITLGLLIAAFLWINEFPDYAADKATGKRTLVVRVGRRKASRTFAVMICLAFLWLAALPWLGCPKSLWGGFVAVPVATDAACCLWRRFDDTSALVPAQSRTLITFMLFAAGASFGLIFF